jgi:hypothetical protein
MDHSSMGLFVARRSAVSASKERLFGRRSPDQLGATRSDMKLLQHVKIRRRLGMAVGLPLIGLVVAALLLLDNYHRNATQLGHLAGLMSITREISGLVGRFLGEPRCELRPGTAGTT